MRPYPTMLPQSANSAGREAALPAALRGLSHRTARPEGSQCEAEKVAVRGRRGRSAKPKRSQCESEEVAVRVRRGRSASPKMSQCESENVAVRTPRTRTAVGLRPHCSYAVRPRGLALRKSSAARMLRSATCVGWCYCVGWCSDPSYKHWNALVEQRRVQAVEGVARGGTHTLVATTLQAALAINFLGPSTAARARTNSF